jgi:hypothetical protein
MSGSEYARAVSWRLSVLLGLTFLFPLFLFALAKATNCQRVSGACGAVGLAGVLYVKPLILLIFAGALVVPSRHRAASAGLPKWYGLFVPLFFLLDWSFFLGWEGRLSVVSRVGISALVLVPYFALAGLLMAAFLALKSSDDDDRFVRVAMIILGLLSAMALTVGGGLKFLLVTRMSPFPEWIPLAILGVIAIMLGRELWRRRNSSPPTPPHSVPPPSRLTSRVQFGRR